MCNSWGSGASVESMSRLQVCNSSVGRMPARRKPDTKANDKSRNFSWRLGCRFAGAGRMSCAPANCSVSKPLPQLRLVRESVTHSPVTAPPPHFWGGVLSPGTGRRWCGKPVQETEPGGRESHLPEAASTLGLCGMWSQGLARLWVLPYFKREELSGRRAPSNHHLVSFSLLSLSQSPPCFQM